jgi:hypothetical protein
MVLKGSLIFGKHTQRDEEMKIGKVNPFKQTEIAFLGIILFYHRTFAANHTAGIP